VTTDSPPSQLFALISTKDTWKNELNQLLPPLLENVNNEERVIENTHACLGKIFALELAMNDIITADTCTNQDYINHIGKLNLFISRAS